MLKKRDMQKRINFLLKEGEVQEKVVEMYLKAYYCFVMLMWVAGVYPSLSLRMKNLSLIRTEISIDHQF